MATIIIDKSNNKVVNYYLDADFVLSYEGTEYSINDYLMFQMDDADVPADIMTVDAYVYNSAIPAMEAV